MQTPSATYIPVAIKTLSYIAMMCVVPAQSHALAQGNEPVAKSYRDRVCDFALLSDGTRLTGIAISESPVRIILRTIRLKADAPDLFSDEIQPAIAQQSGDQNQKLISILQQHADQLRPETPDELQEVGLLDEVIERLNPDEHQTPLWIVVEIEPRRLKRLKTLAANRRELATFALLNQIDEFEDLHWKSITSRLQAIPAAQLIRPVANQQPTPPEVIAERILAAVDVRLNKATRLIQTGDQFLSEDARLNVATLLSTLLGNSLKNTLQELLNEPDSAGVSESSAKNRQDIEIPESARQIAEKNGHATVVVSSFDFDVAGGTAVVTRQLFRNSKLAGWMLVSSTNGSSTTNDVTQEQIQKIENDPQVREISGLLSRLSPDPNALKTALHMGAVVQSALGKADAEFQESLEDIIGGRIDVNGTPPVVVLKAMPVKSCPACGDAE